MRLHLGCGKIVLPGWINIGLKIMPKDDPVVWCRDLREGLPVEDASVDLIHSEHFLEHLTIVEGLKLLTDCHRALKPGGVIRTGTPALEVSIGHFQTGDWRELEWVKDENVKTSAEYINACFRRWGHEYLYNEEELHRRLEQVGFSTRRTVAFGESSVPDLRGLERHPTTTLIVEAVK